MRDTPHAAAHPVVAEEPAVTFRNWKWNPRRINTPYPD
jgi:hypothetical protein